MFVSIPIYITCTSVVYNVLACLCPSCLQMYIVFEVAYPLLERQTFDNGDYL